MTFCASTLQWPEVVPVVAEHADPGAGAVWFRGKLLCGLTEGQEHEHEDDAGA